MNTVSKGMLHHVNIDFICYTQSDMDRAVFLTSLAMFSSDLTHDICRKKRRSTHVASPRKSSGVKVSLS